MSEADEFRVFRSWTSSRKALSVIAKVPGTDWLFPFGAVLSMLQLCAGAVLLFGLLVTVGTWRPLVGGFGPIGYLFVIGGLPVVLVVALRKPTMGGRWLWQHLMGVANYGRLRLQIRSEVRQRAKPVLTGFTVRVSAPR